MKALHLTLKKKWFDMIASGEKKEEYRELKPYWINRLTWHEFHFYPIEDLISLSENKQAQICRKDFDVIEFKNGYSKDSPTIIVKCNGIEIGCPNTRWADAGRDIYFIIKLGEIISRIELPNPERSVATEVDSKENDGKING